MVIAVTPAATLIQVAPVVHIAYPGIQEVAVVTLFMLAVLGAEHSFYPIVHKVGIVATK